MMNEEHRMSSMITYPTTRPAAVSLHSISERSEGRLWLLRSRLTRGIARGDCDEQLGEIYAIEKVK
jgi:hypothetical protein